MKSANIAIPLKRRRYFQSFFIFSIILLSLLILNMAQGSVRIPLFKTLRIIIFHITDSTPGAIIWKIRFPRIFSAVICGGYLAAGGLLLQVFFRNPIVGPYVLGISSGATLMVALVMLGGLSVGILEIHPFYISLSAFSGALLVMAILVVIASRVRSIITLLIIGLMMGYLCYAVTSILIAFAEKEKVKGFVLWQMGSFSGFTWQEFYLIVIIGLPLTIGTYLLSKPLNAFLLGEDYAKTMGVNIRLFRFFVVILSSALAGIVTAFAGPVAFIGLAIPHMARLVFGTTDNRVLIPGAFLLGGVVTLLCDLIARTLFSPVEFPISAITSFFGAPIVIGLLLKRRTAI